VLVSGRPNRLGGRPIVVWWVRSQDQTRKRAETRALMRRSALANVDTSRLQFYLI